MVTLAVAAILIGLAASPMSQMISSNRVQTEASSFVSDLVFARSEAIKRGQGVTVCASSDGSTCSGANTWQTGWIVISDTTQCSSVPPGTQVPVRVRAKFKGSDTLKAAVPTGSTNSCVSFNRDGFAVNMGSSKVYFATKTVPAVTSMTRCVAVDLGGRVTTVTNAADSSCA